MRIDHGITVLECKDFLLPGHTGPNCCPGCHSRSDSPNVNIERGRGGLIYIRPPSHLANQEWIADWSLHMAASVCCQYFDLAASMSNGWWRGKAAELNTQTAYNLHMYSHVDGAKHWKETHETTPKVQQVQKTLIKEKAREEEGGLSSFLNRSR